ncbi:MAG: hypothetical protein ACXWP4_20165 [Polyangiales bacterium]
MRRSLLLAVFLLGCSSEEASQGEGTLDTGVADTNVGPDTALFEDSLAIDTGAADSAIDSSADSSSGDADVAIDSAPDSVVDSSCDAGAIEVTLTADVFADCMPIVAADPVHVSGMITVKNTSGCAIGPVTSESGVLKSGATAWASCKIDKIDLGVIAPGATKTASYTKTAGTLSHDPGVSLCGGTGGKCGSDVTVELTVFGVGSPTGNPVAAPSGSYVCAF